MSCTERDPCGGLLVEDAGYLVRATNEGLHHTRMFRCMNGHTFMIGADAKNRGWTPRRDLRCRCDRCGEPIDGTVREVRGNKRHRCDRCLSGRRLAERGRS